MPRVQTEQTRARIRESMQRVWETRSRVVPPEVVAKVRARVARHLARKARHAERTAARQATAPTTYAAASAPAAELTHATDCFGSLACELTSMRARTAARRARST